MLRNQQERDRQSGAADRIPGVRTAPPVPAAAPTKSPGFSPSSYPSREEFLLSGQADRLPGTPLAKTTAYNPAISEQKNKTQSEPQPQPKTLNLGMSGKNLDELAKQVANVGYSVPKTWPDSSMVVSQNVTKIVNSSLARYGVQNARVTLKQGADPTLLSSYSVILPEYQSKLPIALDHMVEGLKAGYGVNGLGLYTSLEFGKERIGKQTGKTDPETAINDAIMNAYAATRSGNGYKKVGDEVSIKVGSTPVTLSPTGVCDELLRQSKEYWIMEREAVSTEEKKKYRQMAEDYKAAYRRVKQESLNQEKVFGEEVKQTGAGSNGAGNGAAKISLDGAKLLAEMEVAYDSKYMVKEDGKVKGIITHDVGDGGLTVGYGYYIKGGLKNTEEIKRLKNKYGIDVQEGAMVDIDKVLKLYADSLTTYENKAKDYVKMKGLRPSQQQFDALVIQCYNGRHYSVLDAIGDMSLNDAQALDKALEKYRTFGDWEKYKEGWTNRIKNTINLYRHGDYTKLY